MLAAVGNVLGGIVNEIKILFAQLAIGAAEPIHVESAHVQFVIRKGRESGDDGLFLLVKLLVHVGHEVIAGGFEAGESQIFANDIDPVGAVKGSLHQPFLGDIRILQEL